MQSNDLVESIAEITISAGSMKAQEGGAVPKFNKATSYEDAEGIYVIMGFGCNYRPNGDVTQEMSDMIVRAGIRELGPIVSDLFLTPLRNDLNWHELAAKVANAAVEVTIPDFPVYTRDKGRYAEISVKTFVKFDSSYGFNLTPGEDDSQAFAIPHDYEKYVLALFDLLKSSPYRLGTVCTQGNKFKISFEQSVHDILKGKMQYFEKKKDGLSDITDLLEGWSAA